MIAAGASVGGDGRVVLVAEEAGGRGRDRARISYFAFDADADETFEALEKAHHLIVSCLFDVHAVDLKRGFSIWVY